jgi:hypothetical protein
VAPADPRLSNEDIAERLFLVPPTVKKHANQAMAKTLDARDRAQHVVVVFPSGLGSAIHSPRPPPQVVILLTGERRNPTPSGQSP